MSTKDPLLSSRQQAALLTEFIFGLKQAEGASSVLIHFLGDPRFIAIREALFITKDVITRLATFQSKLTIFKGE